MLADYNKDGFILFYVKNNNVYPIALNRDQKIYINSCLNCIEGKVKVIEESQGKIMCLNDNNEKK